MPAGRPRPSNTVLVANPSADLYGSDRMMLEAVHGLVGLGWRVVVTCSGDGPLIGMLRQAGAEIRIMAVPVVRKSMLSPRGLLQLAQQGAVGLVRMLALMRAERPDVILVNTITISLWLVAARLTRTPAVVHVHEAEGSLSRLARTALTAPLVLASRVVYNSEVSRRVAGLRVLDRTGRSVVVHNGVRGPDHVVPARERLAEPFRVVYVGRLSPRKGVDLVVRAVSGLIEQGIPTRLDLVGSVFAGYEWYEAELRALVAELDLTEHVHFLGFQPGVWPFLHRADVAVVPSRMDESFGNTVIEALLAARPVVVSDHTGLKEAAHDFEAALLTSNDDMAGFTARLRTVHDEWPLYRLRARRDSIAAQERYSPARFHASLSKALVFPGYRKPRSSPRRPAGA